MKPQLVCLGEPLIEFNQSSAGGEYSQGIGGDVSNVAVAAARLGTNCAIFTHIGSDEFGNIIRNMWSREGIDHSHVKVNQNAPTGVYFVTHGESGHDFSYLRAGSASSRISPEDIPEELIASSSILHLSAISQAISSSACDACFHAMDCAKSNGVKISYDTNLRLSLWPIFRARAIIKETLGHVDYLLPGLDDAQLLTGLSDPNSILDYFLDFGISAIALTMGAEGVLVATSDKREKIMPYPVSVLDATGAGDAFDGAFLAEILSGRDVFTAAGFANASAALSTEGYGAVPTLPDRDRVNEFLMQHKQD